MSDAEEPKKELPPSIDMAALRLRAVAKQPYLATALWSMTLVETHGIGTMAVDTLWRCYIDPAIDEKWTQDQQVGVLVHEVWHLLRDHATRAKSMGITGRAEGYKWNVAADYGINDDLRREVDLPPDGAFPEKLGLPHGLSAEEYYDLLPDPDNKTVKAVMMSGESDPLNGNDGSGVHGLPEEWDKGEGDDGGGKGEGEGDNPNPLPNGISEAEAELVRQQVAHDISTGKNAGKSPGFAKRWADARLHPKANWRTLLAGAIRSGIAQVSGMVDFTYSKPSRRQSAMGRIIMPSLRGPKPIVGIGIDTSGSMSNHDLERVLAETKGILEVINAQVEVYAGDTRAYKKQTIYQPSQIELMGGGGTDMGAILERMGEDKPDIAVILTDGYTPWRDHKPKGLNTVVVCCTQSGTIKNVPTWAKAIEVLD